jgi:hypothetical protein
MTINRVTDLTRAVLMQGEGLRPVLRFARKHPVSVIRVDHSVNKPGHYAVTFYFEMPHGHGHAECCVLFADWRVLLDFVLARRSWSVDRIRFAEIGLFEYATTTLRVAALRKRGTTVCG